MEEGEHRPRVLVVEDDREIAELVAAYLGRDGALVELVGSAEAGLESAAVTEPELVLLDLGLPGADGLEFLRAFRARSTAPVIIVSARESDEDKIAGLGLGADDFVSKPFSPRVLAARARAQLRRASYPKDAAGHGPGKRLGFGPYSLDLEARLLERGGQRVALSRREFELLAYLALNAGQTFAPAELYRAVWGLEHGDLSTVAVHVQRIRRKIEAEPSEPRWLVTVPGQGYRFVPGPS
ncbi:MAG TPA: response regulator transcription factor [Rectinemataceae bacterium]|nr:response regulator transcription factor [Rectinemataceae bacterium]